MRDLLEKQYEFATGQWVKTDAAKASNMKQSETLRYASTRNQILLCSELQCLCFRFIWDKLCIENSRPGLWLVSDLFTQL